MLWTDSDRTVKRRQDLFPFISKRPRGARGRFRRLFFLPATALDRFDVLYMRESGWAQKQCCSQDPREAFRKTASSNGGLDGPGDEHLPATLAHRISSDLDRIKKNASDARCSG